MSQLLSICDKFWASRPPHGDVRRPEKDKDTVKDPLYGDDVDDASSPRWSCSLITDEIDRAHFPALMRQ